MPHSTDITGRWQGMYSQHGREHPITADFAQVDEHLQGRMLDGVTSFETSIFEAALEAGLPPGADEQMELRLRQQHPDLPRGPIRACATVPETSILEGEVTRRVIRFTKTYLGEYFSGWKVGERVIGSSVPSHVVHYRGKLSDDDLTIEGQWWVEADARRGTQKLNGRFVLNRLED